MITLSWKQEVNRNVCMFKSLLWKTSSWTKTLQVKTPNLHFSMDMILKLFLMNCERVLSNCFKGKYK